MIQEFKDFISKGNLLELAVALIMALAIKAVIDALVNGILMPIIGIVVGKSSFSDLVLKIGDGRILYGAFLSEVINFLIIAFVVFMMLKFYNRLVSLKGTKEAEADAPDELQLLTEIRDALRSK